MSWEASAWALKQQTGSPSGKAVLLCLANYANEKHYCWPSQEVIARQTEQSVDSVQRRLKELEALGLIVRHRRIRKSGGWAGDGYLLAVTGSKKPALPQFAVATATEQPLRSDGTAAVRQESSSESSTTNQLDSSSVTLAENAIELLVVHDGRSVEEAFAAAAKARGATTFVWKGSKPYKLWTAYREATGITPPELPIVFDKGKAGAWVTSLYPPKPPEQQ